MRLYTGPVLRVPLVRCRDSSTPGALSYTTSLNPSTALDYPVCPGRIMSKRTAGSNLLSNFVSVYNLISQLLDEEETTRPQVLRGSPVLPYLNSLLVFILGSEGWMGKRTQAISTSALILTSPSPAQTLGLSKDVKACTPSSASCLLKLLASGHPQ